VTDKALFLGWVLLGQRDSLRVMADWALLFRLNPVVALLHGLIKWAVFVIGSNTLGFLADRTHDKHNESGDNNQYR